MKKALLGILTFLSFNLYSQEVLEQSPKKNPLQVGFRIGMASSTLEGTQWDFKEKNDATLTKRQGLDIGVGLKIWMGNYVYTRIEFNYIQKGGIISGGGFIYDDHAYYNYINVPFILGISLIPRTEKVTLSIEGGAGLNILVSEDQNLKQGLHPDHKFNENSSIPSYNLGANFEYNINSKVSFFANYRYFKDLDFFFKRTLYWDDGNGITTEDFDLWNKGGSFTIGLMFTPKK